jgi:hypothetical protein
VLCADRAGHPGLKVWLRNEQCTIARWAGWHHESLRYTQLAAPDAPAVQGTAAVGRALREARAHAALGNQSQARAALTAATEAREQVQPDELDEIGGALTLPAPSDRFITVDALSLLPDYAAAEQAATDALAAFDDAPAESVHVTVRAGIRVQLALARAQQGDADGAREALRPVFDLPVHQRVPGNMVNLRRVQAALDDSRYHGSSTAREAAAEIEAFTQFPAQAGLPD